MKIIKQWMDLTPYVVRQLDIKNWIYGDVLDLTGCFGWSRLRVRALFTVINEQTKLNAKNNVIEANFAPAYAVAA